MYFTVFLNKDDDDDDDDDLRTILSIIEKRKGGGGGGVKLLCFLGKERERLAKTCFGAKDDLLRSPQRHH